MTGANVIVDLSHHNVGVNLAAAQGDGIKAVIHKATQGTAFKDPNLTAIRQKSNQLGLLFGAYHFATGGDGLQQAAFFLDMVQPAAGDLLVLDLEANPQGPSMTLEEARAFVTHVQAATGKFPGLYAGHYLKELLGTATDPVLRNCWFWLSQYGPTPVVPHAWPTWTMWQYTDGANGPMPHEVAGIGRCDRDTFNGSADDLVSFWKSNSAPAPPPVT